MTQEQWSHGKKKEVVGSVHCPHKGLFFFFLLIWIGTYTIVTFTLAMLIALHRNTIRMQKTDLQMWWKNNPSKNMSIPCPTADIGRRRSLVSALRWNIKDAVTETPSPHPPRVLASFQLHAYETRTEVTGDLILFSFASAAFKINTVIAIVWGCANRYLFRLWL